MLEEGYAPVSALGIAIADQPGIGLPCATSSPVFGPEPWAPSQDKEFEGVATRSECRGVAQRPERSPAGCLELDLDGFVAFGCHASEHVIELVGAARLGQEGCRAKLGGVGRR